MVRGGHRPNDAEARRLCGGTMAIAGGIWGAATGVASLGAGFVVGVGFSFFSDRVCSR